MNPHTRFPASRPALSPRLIPLFVLLAALASGQASVPAAEAATPCHVPSAAYPTIQSALDAAACDTINVAAGTYTGRPITIRRNVTLRGAGQATTIIDGGGNSRVFSIVNFATVTIKGVTIRNGRDDSNFASGIYNGFGSTLTLQNSTIAGNSAGTGGGIFNTGTLTVSNSTITGNSAAAEGAGIANGGTLTVSNSTIAGNSASVGGGIYNAGTLTVRNSTIAGNSASDGGGIYHDDADGGTVSLTRTTLVNNTPNDCTGCPPD